MRILILYRELAGYFLSCLEEFCHSTNSVADVVAYPVNPDAPFTFRHSNRIQIHSRYSLSDDQLVDMINTIEYKLIFTGGWFDKGYLRALQKKRCPAVLAFDNAWRGSIKQHLSVIYGRWFIKPLFNFAFVPGEKQATLARNLGFSSSQIIKGVYSCDFTRFSSIKPFRQDKFRLFYTGRYSEEKFILPLFETFDELAESHFPNWELHAIGTGPLWERRMISKHIIHHGFMQPDELLHFMSSGNAFVLPSTFEPWGVVVHEFAAAGYPLVLSDAVGAAEAFLEYGVNGYTFPAGDKAKLKAALQQLMSHNASELEQMGARSRALASTITPKTWAASLANIIQ